MARKAPQCYTPQQAFGRQEKAGRSSLVGRFVERATKKLSAVSPDRPSAPTPAVVPTSAWPSDLRRSQTCLILFPPAGAPPGRWSLRALKYSTDKCPYPWED